LSESLSQPEIAALRQELQAVLSLLRNVKPEMQAQISENTRMVSLLTSSLALTRQLGLPDDIQAGIEPIRRMTAALIALRLALHQVEMAAGPVGWALAGISFVSLGFSAYDMVRGR